MRRDAARHATACAHLAVCSEGWINGDVDTVMPSLADEYQLDDPHFGRIVRDGGCAHAQGRRRGVAV